MVFVWFGEQILKFVVGGEVVFKENGIDEFIGVEVVGELIFEGLMIELVVLFFLLQVEVDLCVIEGVFVVVVGEEEGLVYVKVEEEWVKVLVKFQLQFGVVWVGRVEFFVVVD